MTEITIVATKTEEAFRPVFSNPQHKGRRERDIMELPI